MYLQTVTCVDGGYKPCCPRYGRCQEDAALVSAPPRPQDFNPFKTCTSTQSCLETDINMICNTDLTTEVDI